MKKSEILNYLFKFLPAPLLKYVNLISRRGRFSLSLIIDGDIVYSRTFCYFNTERLKADLYTFVEEARSISNFYNHILKEEGHRPNDDFK